MYRLLLLLAGFIFSVHIAECQSPWIKVREELLFDAPPFKACHASTITEIAKGKVLVACFGGAYEGSKDVVIWAGVVGKNGKVIPSAVATGKENDTLQYPCWNPVLFNMNSGKLVLFYKVGPNPREWWGMMKTSVDNGRSWSAAMRLPEHVLGPIKNKPVILKDGTILCPSSIEEPNGKWWIQIEQTDQTLTHWKTIPVDAQGAFDAIQPSILSYGKDTLQLVCRSKQGRVVQAWSYDNGRSWSGLSAIEGLLNPNAGTDAVTLKDGIQLIVYNPDVPGKEWYNGRGKLCIASSENGRDWENIMTLEDKPGAEFSYPAIIQTADGQVHITYTYDRKNIKHIVLKKGRSK
ncbi:sialidase family protein [Chitinophaga dinghuensis]|nr:sialidase family protein [Chitinophaga dinghuensis]